MNLLKHFAIAWQFLTIIPILKRLEPTPADLGRSMAFYSVVGFLLGGILWIFWKMLTSVFPSPVVDLILVALLVILTGGIHMDGLADTVDGLLGGRDREQALKIMRDEHIGAFGVVALILMIMAKYLTLTQVPLAIKGQILFGMPAIGRWAMVAVSFFSEYARSGPGLARPFMEHLSWRELTGSTVTIVVILFWLLRIQGLIHFTIIILVSFLCWWYFRRKIGGVTGDCLGALGELVELSFLLSVLAMQGLMK